MTLKKILPIVLLLAWTLPALAAPQKRTTRPKRRPVAAPQPPPIDMAAEAAPVAEQLKIVSRFVYIYGKIVNGLEVAEDQVKRGETSPEIVAQNKKTRDGLVANISALRVGIEKVGQRLQAETRLQVQYLKLTTASDAISNAEKLAAAGRYDDAGKTLVAAIERLAETIISFR